MSMTFVFATNNQGKMVEIKKIFQEAGLEISCLADFGLTFEPTETGDTFEENAMQKARKTFDFLSQNSVTGAGVLSDDSGLCIDAMGGLPGVDSANYMGRDTEYSVRNNHIVRELEGLPISERAARFVSVIACVLPDGTEHTTRATVEGHIADSPSGTQGFGYDPIFFVPEFNKTMAELALEEKNSISHRSRALGKMLDLMKNEWMKNENISCK